jgi:tetratricopeptide (TPR) repeat protein
MRFSLAEIYAGEGLMPKALEQYDLWIAAHAESGEMVKALNGRCWALAVMNRDLDKALADCNKAVRLAPNVAQFLDSRGLVRLRRGELKAAIADYDAALAIWPKNAWSLYGRGLARLRTGETARGEADLASAIAISPDIAKQAGEFGLTQTEGGGGL